jgi:SAM-dependent methyltransferase
MPKDRVLPHLNAHARGSSILDIGCGPGAIGEAINPTTYRHYIGVDISDVAIAKASAKNFRLNNVYAQGDMWTFNPPGTYDLIFFGDSLYNFSFPSGKKILARYSSYLNEGGVFVIRTWVSVDRTRAIIKLIESDYDVIEKRSYGTDATGKPNPLVVIVFKPKDFAMNRPGGVRVLPSNASPRPAAVNDNVHQGTSRPDPVFSPGVS